LISSESEIIDILSNWTDKLTKQCFIHSTENDRFPFSPTSHFIKFLNQPAFGTFAKPQMPTHKQSFAKEPNFASFSVYWRFFDFQIKPEFVTFGKNWVEYA